MVLPDAFRSSNLRVSDLPMSSPTRLVVLHARIVSFPAFSEIVRDRSAFHGS